MFKAWRLMCCLPAAPLVSTDHADLGPASRRTLAAESPGWWVRDRGLRVAEHTLSLALTIPVLFKARWLRLKA